MYLDLLEIFHKTNKEINAYDINHVLCNFYTNTRSTNKPSIKKCNKQSYHIYDVPNMCLYVVTIFKVFFILSTDDRKILETITHILIYLKYNVIKFETQVLSTH